MPVSSVGAFSRRRNLGYVNLKTDQDGVSGEGQKGLNARQHLGCVCRLIAYHRNAKHGPPMIIQSINLGTGNRKTLPGSGNQALHHPPLVFERAALRQLKLGPGNADDQSRSPTPLALAA